jgi:hypothetical protein
MFGAMVVKGCADTLAPCPSATAHVSALNSEDCISNTFNSSKTALQRQVVVMAQAVYV